jgi:hypothetical protein
VRGEKGAERHSGLLSSAVGSSGWGVCVVRAHIQCVSYVHTYSVCCEALQS